MSLQRPLEGWDLFKEGARTGKKYDPSDAFRNKNTTLAQRERRSTPQMIKLCETYKNYLNKYTGATMIAK